MGNISRRDFIKITAAAGGSILGASLIARGIWKPSYTLTGTRTLMGTIIHLKLICHDEVEGQVALNATFDEMQRLVSMFNLRDGNSQVSKLNQAGMLDAAPGELLEVLHQSHYFGDLTGGAFDISIQPVLDRLRDGKQPDEAAKQCVDYQKIAITGQMVSFQIPGMQITLDGIAKGYIVDRGIDTLKQFGFDRVLVEAGGDLAVHSRNSDEELWQIGVASPRPENLAGYIAVFSIGEGAVATSGDYLNWFKEDKSSHHIIDPETYQSPGELASVTVHASSALRADALSTAILVMGADAGLKLANSLDDVEALVVSKEMNIKRTGGFPTSAVQ